MSGQAFIDEENVECLLCNVRFKLLCSHVKKKHNLTMRDYKRKFPGEPVACLRVSRKKAKHGKRLVAHCNELTPEQDAVKRKKLSNAAKAQWSNPETRKRTITAQTKGKLASTLYKESHREAIKIATATPGRKEKAAAGAKKALTEKWKDPAWRKSQRERLSLLQTERMHAGTNAWVNHHTRRANCIYEGPQGPLTMRSSWEVIFAYQLDTLGIEWLYEPDHFPYTIDDVTKNYTPDFFLPLYGYIEVKPDGFFDDTAQIKLESVPCTTTHLSESNWPFDVDSPLTLSLELLESLYA